ncbi:NAD-dependent protein deacetylase [[Clostridium] cellulosi]|uniref:NAD-dependent protein deacetylase n=1 Tax=[Clostridium] cellulosi TaxID=29343 RepID=A0A078KQ83_9FIRM|nr:NAD-dependent protein deacetylase [[Clostridium] cellulosi]
MDELEEKIERLASMISESKRIVAFTGAGVSTESNIPDFRSSKGVYESIQKEYKQPAERLLSHSYFEAHPEIFFDYLRRFLVFPDALPNDAHKSLAALERIGKLSCVVTQNIDGLHTKAGNKNVCELHGSLYRNYCIKCGEKYDLDFVLSAKDIPRCKKCGGIVRPDVVLYEELLDEDVMEKAANEIINADMLLIMGTSLAVYPAAGFIRYFRGENIVIINRDATPYDGSAKLLIKAKAGETMRAVMNKCKIEF